MNSLTIIKQNKEKNNREIEKFYKQNSSYIKKICFFTSKYYKVDYEDLLSEANEILFSCIKKYTYKKVPFTAFFRKQLNIYLKWFALNELKQRARCVRLFSKICETSYHYDKYFTEINFDFESVREDIALIAIEILELCFNPEITNILSPYFKKKNKYQTKQTISKQVILRYFHDQFNYSERKIRKAFSTISFLLKEQNI